MNKFLLSLVLIFLGFAANAQVPKKSYIAGSTSANIVVARNGLEADQQLFTPVVDTTFIPYRIGVLVTRPQDGQLYIYLDHWYPFKTTPTTITVENGLFALNDTTVLWGGTLIENTTVDGQNLYSITLNNLTNFTVDGPMTLTDGNQGDGLMLSSDANGNLSYGPPRYNVVSITQTSYSVAAGISFILVNDAGATTTVTLPSASANKGRMITIDNQSSSHNVSVTPVKAGETNTLGLKGVSQSAIVSFISDGSNWYNYMRGVN